MEKINTNKEVKAYMNNILRNSPALDPEEQEKQLNIYFETKSKKVLDLLVKANLKLVMNRVNHYVWNIRAVRQSVDDLFQEGCIGLMRGIERFDPTRGIKLSSYAVHWIDAYIRKYIDRHATGIVRVNTTQDNRQILQNLGNSQALENILAKANDTQRDSNQYTLSIIRQSANNADSDSIAFGNLSSNGHTQEALVIKKDMAERLNQLVNSCRLNSREQYILDHRLLSDDELTLNEIAIVFGMTRERVRQIEELLIYRLKKKKGTLQ